MKPKPLGNMLGAFQRRHKIGRQLLAVEVIRAAQEALREIAQPPLQDDVRIQSFANGTLVVACRNPLVQSMFQPLREPLRLAITARLGQVDLIVLSRLVPVLWASEEQYER